MKTNTLCLIILSIFIFSCHPEKNDPVDLTQLTNKTTDPSELFFKNVRQSYYDLTELKDAKMNLFRLKTYPEDANINLQLVINWKIDASYLMVSWKNKLDSLNDLEIIFKSQSSISTLPYTANSIQDQVSFSISIYNSILSGDSIFIQTGKQSFPLFESQQAKESFRITVFDYLRLTEVR